MRLFPAIKIAALAVVCCAALAAPQALAQQSPQPYRPPSLDQMQRLQEQLQAAALATGNAAQKPAEEQTSLFDRSRSNNMTQEEYEAEMEEKESPTYKASELAKKARRTNEFNQAIQKHKEEDLVVTEEIKTPPELVHLQDIKGTHGVSGDLFDEIIGKELSLDLRRDSQREAALSYGARGGLAKRSYQVTERLRDYNITFDKVFNFRSLLIRAPSGLLIEPPIVRESLDALSIEEDGAEAAVADQILKINKQAKIVTAPRDWRQYLDLTYTTEIQPPPRVLWPKNEEEQKRWNKWVRQGWEAGYAQGEQIFEANLALLVSDYEGMVRYRVLLAEGKISQPYALQEDRGVTGGRNEMRVGDRALRITGPSQFLTGAELWKPADR